MQRSHIDKNNPSLVNVLTIGLKLTGKIIDLEETQNIVPGLIKKLGQPFILAAAKKAIKVISNEFIIGEDLPSSLEKSKNI